MMHTVNTGAWLSACPGLLERTSLASQEWCDGLFLNYALTPAGLPHFCVMVCSQLYSINHAINCIAGGLITNRQYEICQELGALACDISPICCPLPGPLLYQSGMPSTKHPLLPQPSSHPLPEILQMSFLLSPLLPHTEE